MSLYRQLFPFLILLILVSGSELAVPAEQVPNPAPSTSPIADQQVNPEELEAEIGFNIYAEQWTGDLDEMESQRLIRVLTVYGLGRYFLDGGRPKGITYDLFSAFEDFINERCPISSIRLLLGD